MFCSRNNVTLFKHKLYLPYYSFSCITWKDDASDQATKQDILKRIILISTLKAATDFKSYYFSSIIEIFSIIVPTLYCRILSFELIILYTASLTSEHTMYYVSPIKQETFFRKQIHKFYLGPIFSRTQMTQLSKTQ